jgi:hypothetical protein
MTAVGGVIWPALFAPSRLARRALRVQVCLSFEKLIFLS